MEQHDQGIVRRRHFNRALGQQGRRVAPSEPEFGQPLDGDQRQQDGRWRHAALLKDTQLAVKPGPIAVRSVRDGNPASISRSSTKSAVGADMLPYSASTVRS